MDQSEPEGVRSKGSLVQSVVAAVALTGLILGLVTMISYLRYGSLKVAVASIRSESIIADQEVKYVDVGEEAEVLAVSYELRNISGSSAAVTGYKVSCECMTGDRMPLVIGPGEARAMQFRVESEGHSRGFRREIVLITDQPDQPFLNLKIIGNPKS